MAVRAYLRKSRGEEADPEVLAMHRAILCRLAEADGTPLAPTDIIEELGSADTLSERPRLRALLEALQQLPAPLVLYCMEIDRLTRGPLPDRAAVYVALLTAGVLIRTPSRWYDLANPDDELLFEMKALFARQELSFYRHRVKAVWEQMTRKGIVLTGVAPKGYLWDKNLRNFVIEPLGAATVRALFAAAPDVSTYRLGQQFGMRPSSVLRILSNPVYTGYPARHCVRHRFQGRKHSSGTKYLGREEWTWPEEQGTYPPLVTRAQFERVQEALRSRHRVGEKTGTTEAWARDVLQFEDMSGHVELGSHGRVGGRYLVYQVKGEKRLYVARGIVHAAAETAVLRVLNASGLAAAAAQALEASLVASNSPPARDEAALQTELAQLRRQLDELLARELAATDGEERASIARVRARHRERAAVLVQELQRFQPSPGDAPALARLLEEHPGLFSQGAGAWRDADETLRRLLTRVLLSRLVVRITPRRKPDPYLREVVLIEYQSWLKRLAENLVE